MGSAPSSSEASGVQGRIKLPLPMLLIVVMVGVWLGLAGGAVGLYFLAKFGKLPMPPMVSGGAGAVASGTHSLMLEPILVNLADEGGHAYLRVGLTLDVAGGDAAAAAPPAAAPAEGAKVALTEVAGGGKPTGTSNSAVRDIVLTVLGRQTSASLLGPDGKEHLKIELREAITKSDLKMDVKDVYFSDFLVQS